MDAILPDCDDVEVRTLGWLLTKILGDDLVANAQGQVQLGEGTAPERVVGVTGSRDASWSQERRPSLRRLQGGLRHRANQRTAAGCGGCPAPGSDGQQLIPALQRVEVAADVTVAQVLADGACGSGDIRATCAAELGHAVDLVVPVAQPADPEVAKAAFHIDLPARPRPVRKVTPLQARRARMRRDAPS